LTWHTIRRKEPGLPPGTLVHTGEEKSERVNITIMTYNAETFEEKQVENIADCLPLKENFTVTWISVDGVHQISVVEEMGKHFDIHPLVLEDIVNVNQRPKMEDHEQYIFLVFPAIYYDQEEETIKAEQISLVLGPRFLISFQETNKDIFGSIKERIRNNKGLIRKRGTDYLAYALLDTVVDSYFVILEMLGEKLDAIEEGLVNAPSTEILRSIHKLRTNCTFLRKSLWPLRELVASLERSGSSLIQDFTRAYLRDVYDHVIQIIEGIETFRDMLSGILDVYLSSVNNRMNEVMKVLTIIATLFIPLSFIAGIYGMNFEYMPELKWKWGYFTVLGVMALVSFFMLLYFKLKKWF